MCDKTAIFIEKARAKHGKRYDYSLVEYVNAHTKISIICPDHGVFTTTPNKHLTPRFCPECSGKKRYTNDEYIAKVSAIHGFKYSYEKTKYTTSKAKIIITCPVHGDFQQSAGKHILGQGCRGCRIDDASDRYRMTVDEFVTKARVIHGDKYDYSRFDYTLSATPSWITCPDHGDFMQSANSHLSGSGCPSCHDQFNKPWAVYVLLSECRGSKIGISQNPLNRLARIGKVMDFDARLYAFNTAKNWFAARSIESRIHKDIAHLNCGYTGFDGATEWFNIDPKEAYDMVKQAVLSEGVLATRLRYT